MIGLKGQQYSDVTKKVGDIAISLLLARGVYYLAFVSKIYSYSKMCFPGVGYPLIVQP